LTVPASIEEINLLDAMIVPLKPGMLGLENLTLRWPELIRAAPDWAKLRRIRVGYSDRVDLDDLRQRLPPVFFGNFFPKGLC
jgi:hypothetical protein